MFELILRTSQFFSKSLICNKKCEAEKSSHSENYGEKVQCGQFVTKKLRST